MPRFLPVLVPIVIFVGSSVLLAPRTASAQTTGTAALVIGSRAPKLPVAEWVKGTPVRIGDGKIHVVEFWATWCGPCKVSIPRLTQLSKKYAGKADFTGVSIWERGGDIPTRVKAL